MQIIQTDNLSKNFGQVKAVDRVSLHVGQGEIYGFLGLNGAGKTTTIRMLLGMIRPSSGQAMLFGKDLAKRPDIWNDVGYMVETPCAYPELSVHENLSLFCHMRGLKGNKLIGQTIDKLKLGPYCDRKAGHLSLGNKQRLGLAKALMHKPRLLLLDEPINGLDPAGIVEVRGLLRELVSRHGTTLFLSSHILSEVAQIAMRIGIIHEGALISKLDSRELKDQTRKKLWIDCKDNTKAMHILQKRKLNPEKEEGKLTCRETNCINEPETIARALVEGGCPPRLLQVEEEDLEHFFMRMIGESGVGK